MPNDTTASKCMLTGKEIPVYTPCIGHLICLMPTPDGTQTEWVPMTPAFRAMRCDNDYIDTIGREKQIEELLTAMAPVVTADGTYRPLQSTYPLRKAIQCAHAGQLFLADRTDGTRLLPIRPVLYDAAEYHLALLNAKNLTDDCPAPVNPLFRQMSVEHMIDPDKVESVILLGKWLHDRNASWNPAQDPNPDSKTPRPMRAKTVKARKRDTGLPVDGWETVMATQTSLVLVKTTDAYELRLEREYATRTDKVHGCLMHDGTVCSEFTKTRSSSAPLSARDAREWAVYMARTQFNTFLLAAQAAVGRLDKVTEPA